MHSFLELHKTRLLKTITPNTMENTEKKYNYGTLKSPMENFATLLLELGETYKQVDDDMFSSDYKNYRKGYLDCLISLSDTIMKNWLEYEETYINNRLFKQNVPYSHLFTDADYTSKDKNPTHAG